MHFEVKEIGFYSARSGIVTNKVQIIINNSEERERKRRVKKIIQKKLQSECLYQNASD